MSSVPGDSDAARLYQDAATAQLSERVTNMGRRINDVEVEMRAGFNQLGNSLSAATNETRTSIAGLSTSLAERSRPQWQALSVMLGVVVVLGGLVYWPIRETTSDIKQTLQTLTDKMVTRDEIDWRSARGTEDRARTEAEIVELRSGSVTRAEWTERNGSRDHQLDAIEREIADLKLATSSVYNTRDIILDLRNRIDQLEHAQAQ